jgi:crotonobetainyl-CoA:carnitine CoA-transferase CaiB-like acyl-CoA transferase
MGAPPDRGRLVSSKFAQGPLSDLRVIEMGTLLAGPFCGQLLGDLGAEVIKIEPPNQGDPLRAWGQEKINGKSLWWPVVARNKKAITLDMRQAEGQALLKELVKKTDFLVENFRRAVQDQSSPHHDPRVGLRSDRSLFFACRLWRHR